VDDIDVTKRKNQLAYFREKVGFLFQNFALVENKTVRQNLELVRRKNRSDVSIEQAVEKVGLSDKLDAKVYTLSGGEQQRIALARLMVKKCSLILADEPTGSLDKANASKIMEILKSLNSQGKTVIMVTHDEELKKQGSRVIEISDGR
ncbi:MAG: ATP-binding cassette domain-containing protein, partial [Ruminococcus sp.]|nr:ATP-binding cassette domain-containing protein [Ruminococcus sp.]